ncbi:MAG TPA: ATP-binding cassette domain-containing protein, partial [Pirellulales bacterium]|nr:ATP-binding cassette domain-containing protein [Pirellulales bacterium]
MNEIRTVTVGKASAPRHALGAATTNPRPATARLQAVGLEKHYRKAQVEIPVLRGVDLSVASGEFLAIIGQSGSGKSTLLHLLGTLDAPDAGEVHFDGRRIDNLPS